eukprot:TRINITY_DN18245_c0_g1_i1.p1 TRINITY_DN18245_c0_g1~~TRINITY_DN18245_c0_g1_i1.p1  ORF type:complete len:904 (+),score=165.72 TRINITY_DN18245_c0_g1_i1:474-3185(+)
MLPTFPWCDLRPAMLKTHFAVSRLPQLVILDPHGVVVTTDGVARARGGPGGFPWMEPVVGNIWGPRAITTNWGRLEALNLPDCDDIPAGDHSVVGLVFGEPWCPDTRDLLRRVHYLRECVMSAAGGEVSCAFYFVHAEPVEKFDKFLSDWRSLPLVALPKGEQRNWLLHMCNVEEMPSFCLVSPRNDWMVTDARDWVVRDPSGLYYPWVPWLRSLTTGTEFDLEEIQFCDCVKELKRPDLNETLIRGPVFVAVLEGRSDEWSEVLATMRALAVAYRHRTGALAIEKDKARREVLAAGVKDIAGVKDKQAAQAPSQRRPLGLKAFIEDQDELLEDMCAPSGSREGSVSPMDDKRGFVERLREAVMRSSRGHEVEGWASEENSRVFFRKLGSSSNQPLANQEDDKRHSRTSALSFCYCSAGDEVSRILKRFCKFDEKVLVKIAAGDEEWHSRMQDGRSQMRRLEEEVNGLLAEEGGLRRKSRQFLFQRRSYKERGEDDVDDVYSDGETDDEDGLNAAQRRFVPNFESHGLTNRSKSLLKRNQGGFGTGIIIDLALGTYHVCGNLADASKIVKFVEMWYEGDLHSFDISSLGSDDKPHDIDAQRNQIVSIPSQVREQVQIVPTMCIWLPNFEHSVYSTPADTFNVILDYAYHFTSSKKAAAMVLASGETRSSADQMRILGAAPNLSGTHQQVAQADQHELRMCRRMIPSIDWFWIYTLAGSNYAQKKRTHAAIGLEAAMQLGSRPPPGAAGTGAKAPPEFITELRSMVDASAGVLQPSPAVAEATRNAVDDCESASETLSAVLAPKAGRLNMHQATSRASLHKALLDDMTPVLASHTLPISVIIIGNLPSCDHVVWPQTLSRSCCLHVVGEVEELDRYRTTVAPQMHVVSWDALVSMQEDHTFDQL